MTEEFDWIGERTQRRNERNLRRMQEKRRLRAQRRLRRKQAVENFNQGLENLQGKLVPVFQPNTRFNKSLERFRAFTRAEYAQLQAARSSLLAKGKSLRPVGLGLSFKWPVMRAWLQNMRQSVLALPWRQMGENVRQKSSSLVVGAKGLINQRKWRSIIPVNWIVGTLPVVKFILDLVSFVGILCGLGAAFSFIDNGLNSENIFAFIFAAISIVWFVCTRVRVKFSLRTVHKRANQSDGVQRQSSVQPL
jgi:hypothetical protein